MEGATAGADAQGQAARLLTQLWVERGLVTWPGAGRGDKWDRGPQEHPRMWSQVWKGPERPHWGPGTARRPPPLHVLHETSVHTGTERRDLERCLPGPTGGPAPSKQKPVAVAIGGQGGWREETRPRAGGLSRGRWGMHRARPSPGKRAPFSRPRRVRTSWRRRTPRSALRQHSRTGTPGARLPGRPRPAEEEAEDSSLVAELGVGTRLQTRA